MPVFPFLFRITKKKPIYQSQAYILDLHTVLVALISAIVEHILWVSL